MERRNADGEICTHASAAASAGWRSSLPAPGSGTGAEGPSMILLIGMTSGATFKDNSWHIRERSSASYSIPHMFVQHRNERKQQGRKVKTFLPSSFHMNPRLRTIAQSAV